MTTFASLPSMDENMGLATPNFFTSAWSSDQNDMPFMDAYRNGGEVYSTYNPHIQQGKGEDSQLDYFAGQLDNQFTALPIYRDDPDFELSQSHAELDHILEVSNETLFAKQPYLESTTQKAQRQSIKSFDSNLLGEKGATLLALEKWSPGLLDSKDVVKVEPEAFEAGRTTSVRYGQITPVQSPVDNTAKESRKNPKTSVFSTKSDLSKEANEAPKIKKPRKSRRKPMSKEQEEEKRRKFLERNRVAADKCRQNRKKWIDDLQTKVHAFSAENAVKKARLDELEQEVAQMKSMLFIHSRSCNVDDLTTWIDNESSKVKRLGQTETTVLPDDVNSRYTREPEDYSSNTSRPSSSQGFGSLSDVTSRRCSEAIMDDDFSSTMSGFLSRHSSRRPSTAGEQYP